MRIKIHSFWPGIIGLLIATLLFCLPGSEFPKEDWLSKIHFDKLVHVGLFVMLVVLWSMPFIPRINESKRLFKVFIMVSLSFLFYGIVIEFIQGNFIPYRSFGIDDMIADAVGCGIGFLFVTRLVK